MEDQKQAMSRNEVRNLIADGRREMARLVEVEVDQTRTMMWEVGLRVHKAEHPLASRLMSILNDGWNFYEDKPEEGYGGLDNWLYEHDRRREKLHLIAELLDKMEADDES